MYARKEDKREGGREEEEGDRGRERREMEGDGGRERREMEGDGGREVVTFCEGEELAHVMPGMSSLVKVSLLP